MDLITVRNNFWYLISLLLQILPSVSKSEKDIKNDSSHPKLTDILKPNPFKDFTFSLQVTHEKYTLRKYQQQVF